MQLDHIVKHIRDRAYMDGVTRDHLRRLHTSEFFTPTAMVMQILDGYDQSLFADPSSQWCDNSCGDGQFLGEIIIRKVQSGVSFELALESVFGVDIMPDNVELCRQRLLCGREDLSHIVQRNIVVADSISYDYSFNRRRDVIADVLYFDP